ncbi:MAG: arylformamidase, partial [Parvicella sp.]
MIYKGLTKQTLEAEYNLVARRGANSLATLMTQWTLRSALSRDQLKAKLNISYGREPREKLDLFHSGKPNGPLLVYIHGGYWQRGDKHLYSFLADAYVKHGISVAVLNYGLAPKTPIGEIPIQIRRAITWLWKNAADLGFSRDQFHLMGHSAGGHLTAMMLATDWSVYDRELPTEIVTSAIPISGVFELEPLIHTSLNEALELNADKAIS